MIIFGTNADQNLRNNNMVRVEWYSISDNIVNHYKENVFKILYAPEFEKWLFNETNGKIVYVSNEPYLEFANKEDLVMFTLRWR